MCECFLCILCTHKFSKHSTRKPPRLFQDSKIPANRTETSETASQPASNQHVVRAHYSGNICYFVIGETKLSVFRVCTVKRENNAHGFAALAYDNHDEGAHPTRDASDAFWMLTFLAPPRELRTVVQKSSSSSSSVPWREERHQRRRQQQTATGYRLTAA